MIWLRSMFASVTGDATKRDGRKPLCWRLKGAVANRIKSNLQCRRENDTHCLKPFCVVRFAMSLGCLGVWMCYRYVSLGVRKRIILSSYTERSWISLLWMGGDNNSGYGESSVSLWDYCDRGVIGVLLSPSFLRWFECSTAALEPLWPKQWSCPLQKLRRIFPVSFQKRTKRPMVLILSFKLIQKTNTSSSLTAPPKSLPRTVFKYRYLSTGVNCSFQSDVLRHYNINREKQIQRITTKSLSIHFYRLIRI